MPWSLNRATRAEQDFREQDDSEQDFSEQDSSEQYDSEQDDSEQYDSEHIGQPGASADYPSQSVSERHVPERPRHRGTSGGNQSQYFPDQRAFEHTGHIRASANYGRQEDLDQYESEYPDIITSNDGTRAYRTDDLRAALPSNTADVEQMAALYFPIVWENIHPELSENPNISPPRSFESSQPYETYPEDWEPQTKEQYQEYLGDFVGNNLPSFVSRGLDDATMRRVASKAADRVRRKTYLSPELTPGLAKLAFYDFIFLCDNSRSMREEDRIPALKDTLGRVAKFATILSPKGISIRIVNNNGVSDQAWDDLKTVEDVKHKMKRVQYHGPTPLGTVLRRKIIEPLIAKARDGRLYRPVIVTIITDGEANSEAKNCDLWNTIHYCNDKMKKLMPEDKAAVVLAISRVGTSESARRFVESLAQDEYIGNAIYVNADEVKSKFTAFIQCREDKAYTEELIKFFLAALKVRTQKERADTGNRW
ncbi:hypothetical protein EG329_011881 [Mollisiaceae sp. DMI_Dod_QoI]|nr:hypothetical protein EG329_011881 [Helotiales sp. DMI_Dod_QoI]